MEVPVKKEYYGTKRVTAWEAIKEDILGYAVVYDHGYKSWSPKDVFEAAYQPLDALSFGHAIVAMKQGHKVARAGWNGKGMWIAIKPAFDIEAEAERSHDNWMNYKLAQGVISRLGVDGEEYMVPYSQLSEPAKELDRLQFKQQLNMTMPFIYMKTVDDKLVPWLASQADILADDWMIVA